jgi:hypothetical protein
LYSHFYCGCDSQIAKAVGPAGPNYEYLFRLEESLYQIGALLSLHSPELLLNNQNMLCTVSILHLAMFFWLTSYTLGAFAAGCVDEHIIELAEEVRKHLGHDVLLGGLLL